MLVGQFHIVVQRFHRSNSAVDGFNIYMNGYSFSGELALYGIST